MDSQTRLLYWLLEASRGGPTRVKILLSLHQKPMNMRQLSVFLNLDYKTVQSHVELLIENGILETPKKKYGSIYFISAEWENNDFLNNILGCGNDEKNKRK